jgi:hypothetical protein
MKHFLHQLAIPFLVFFVLMLHGIEAWADEEGTGYPSLFG